ncbi:MAG TPA: ATP-binding protein [Spongiibacteraceae bacterium]|nr:ATP-binding protein [Spongiibacteraceae bacterium]HUH37026.1 ATP-binding protein [Spongiibacteraceae bacterium]
MANTSMQQVSPNDGQIQQNVTLIKLYTWYRAALVLILLVSFFSQGSDPVLGRIKPLLFLYTTSAYLLFNLIALAVLLPRLRRVRPRHLLLNFAIDIAALTLISDASGGIASGLSLLSLLTVAAAGILLTGQAATLIAALATVFLILDTAYLNYRGHLSNDTFLAAGLLGGLYFATSLFIQNLAQRIRSTQELAQRRAEDVSQLLYLNELVVQRMRTGVIVVSEQGRIKSINRSAAEMLESDALLEQCMAGLQPALDPQLHRQWRSWLDRPGYRNPALKFSPTGPDIQPAFAQLQDIPGGDTLIFLEDSSLLAQRAQQLKLASLGRLTASIAHEIRNPLGAISHAVQLLAESPHLDPADQRLYNIIARHSVRMNQIVENVLQLSRRGNATPQRVDLVDWLNQCVADYQQSHDYPVIIDIDAPTQPCDVNIDPSQLRQVVDNLLDNALRYSAAATGTARAQLVVRFKGNQRIPQLDIIDDGPGIKDADQDKIFEPFYTTESSGTGLGLYISRELCEANQARLSYIRSPQGKSCFRISFPHPDRRILTD